MRITNINKTVTKLTSLEAESPFEKNLGAWEAEAGMPEEYELVQEEVVPKKDVVGHHLSNEKTLVV